METGRRNLIFGWLWLLLFMFFGAFIKMKLGDDEYREGYTRDMWRAAHAHGNLFSLINILYGLLLGRASLSPGLKNAGSWLVIAGAVLLPGTLFLSPLAPAVEPLGVLGALCMFAAIGLMAVGFLRKPE